MITTKQTLAVALLALSASVQAQFDVQLPLQYGLQRTVGNPAVLQDHRVTVGVVSAGVGFQTPVAVSEMGTVTDGTLVVEAERLISRLEHRGNEQGVAADVDGLAFNYRRRKWQVGVSHRVRASGSLDVPRDLIRLAAYGNAGYLGQSLQVMPTVSATAYQEFGLNGAYSLLDNLSVGARAKLLIGSAAIETAHANATVYTDPEYYAATITSDILVNSAGIPVTFDGLGVDVGDFDPFNSSGIGFGLDLGVIYRPTDEIEVGASVRDLGSISWAGDARQHRSQGTFSFGGYEGNIFGEDDQSFDVQGTIDSVLSEVQFVSSDAKFSTTLPTTVQGTFRYAMTATTVAQATVYGQQRPTAWEGGFGIGLSQRAGEWLHVGALAGMKSDGGYLGANVLFDIFGPQIYVACDNVLAAANLQAAKSAYFRAGLNLAFGKIKTPKDVRGFYDVRVEGINK